MATKIVLRLTMLLCRFSALRSEGPTTKDKPQANAAGADTRPPGNTKKGRNDPNPPNQPVTCNH
eukprot:5416109-Amphidinium_carterae.2